MQVQGSHRRRGIPSGAIRILRLYKVSKVSQAFRAFKAMTGQQQSTLWPPSRCFTNLGNSMVQVPSSCRHLLLSVTSSLRTIGDRGIMASTPASEHSSAAVLAVGLHLPGSGKFWGSNTFQNIKLTIPVAKEMFPQFLGHVQAWKEAVSQLA